MVVKYTIATSTVTSSHATLGSVTSVGPQMKNKEVKRKKGSYLGFRSFISPGCCYYTEYVKYYTHTHTHTHTHTPIYYNHYYYSLRVFHINVSWWFSTGVWVSASLFFQFSRKVQVLIILLTFFNFTLWPAETAKSTIQQVLFFSFKSVI